MSSSGKPYRGFVVSIALTAAQEGYGLSVFPVLVQEQIKTTIKHQNASALGGAIIEVTHTGHVYTFVVSVSCVVVACQYRDERKAPAGGFKVDKSRCAEVGAQACVPLRRGEATLEQIRVLLGQTHSPTNLD